MYNVTAYAPHPNGILNAKNGPKKKKRIEENSVETYCRRYNKNATAYDTTGIANNASPHGKNS